MSLPAPSPPPAMKLPRLHQLPPISPCSMLVIDSSCAEKSAFMMLCSSTPRVRESMMRTWSAPIWHDSTARSVSRAKRERRCSTSRTPPRRRGGTATSSGTRPSASADADSGRPRWGVVRVVRVREVRIAVRPLGHERVLAIGVPHVLRPPIALPRSGTSQKDGSSFASSIACSKSMDFASPWCGRCRPGRGWRGPPGPARRRPGDARGGDGGGRSSGFVRSAPRRRRATTTTADRPLFSRGRRRRNGNGRRPGRRRGDRRRRPEGAPETAVRRRDEPVGRPEKTAGRKVDDMGCAAARRAATPGGRARGARPVAGEVAPAPGAARSAGGDTADMTEGDAASEE